MRFICEMYREDTFKTGMLQHITLGLFYIVLLLIQIYFVLKQSYIMAVILWF